MKKYLIPCLALLGGILTNAQVPQIERDALMTLYNSTDGANWVDNTNWGSGNPVSTWYGITVENVNGTDHVIWVNLPSNNLSGAIPSELANLTELTLLGFYDNQLSGNLPVFLSNCTKLTVLALDYNNFDGTIPIEYASLTAMESLYFSGNNLTGSATNIYASMPNLERLYLDGNTFVGTLNLSANENLRLVFLMDNNLSSLDLRNGNNPGIETLRVQNNSNLTCIFVDDKNNIPGNWQKDPSATYVETQAECDALSIKEFSASNFELYPNPTNKSFFIDSRISIEKISIYNTFGKLVKSYPSQNGYDVSGLSQGMYIINIENKKGTTTQKLIIE
ncbi:T9SS type A sorting domain-containing protein [Aequorivita todarodis]|uniref:T9SS type A sorting domain-containing protein n=1 Tax=Aequorivita todarodis TaxID=2036821 RepID=UPI002350629D|nr:T9SS type A sorting domain-containing protein [Aequorivita todarodis]MDC8001808.1 T9SS type A sorting domain-containing protein [Aequorivita todarodis]